MSPTPLEELNLKLNQMPSAHLQEGYYLWHRRYFKSDITDDAVMPFLNIQIKPFDKNKISACGLVNTRKALLLSGNNMANKLGVTRSAYSKIEKSEMTGNITLGQLARVAEAMDCELVYALRPKSNIPFSQVIWNKLFDAIKRKPTSKNSRALLLRSRAIFKKNNQSANYNSTLAQQLLLDPQFRKQQGWTERVQQ